MLPPGSGGSSSSAARPKRRARDVGHGAAAGSVPIEVAIPTTEAQEGGSVVLSMVSMASGQQTTLFVVETVALGVSCRAKRLFADFEQLHAELQGKAAYPLPPLPPTFWYGNDEPWVVEERRRQLEGLLQQLLRLPEILGDGEQRLLRFLELPKASAVAIRFLVAEPRARGQWLQALYETTAGPGGFLPLQERSVEVALVGIAREALVADEAGDAAENPLSDACGGGEAVGKWQASAGETVLGDAALACELLARAFQHNDDADAAPSSSGAEGGEVASRVPQVQVLLALACSVEAPRAARAPSPGLQGRPRAARAAAKALLTLARAGRAAWQAALAGFLSQGGTAQLASAAAAAEASTTSAPSAEPLAGDDGAAIPGPGSLRPERLVAELLLRGFEGDVVDHFAAVDVTSHRKRLLNQLFMSRDIFVRVAVGLLLAYLARYGSSGEAAQAEKGLRGLAEELSALTPGDPAAADIVRILSEDELWQWLCRLAGAPQDVISGFALLIVERFVQPCPALIMGTPGFHDLLTFRLGSGVDPAVRGCAARLLFAAHRASAGAAPPSTFEPLCAALAASVEEALLRDAAAHEVVVAGAQRVRSRCSQVMQIGELLQAAGEGAAALQAGASAWGQALEDATGEAEAAVRAHETAREALEDQRDRVASGAAQGVAGEADDLRGCEQRVATEEASVATAEANLQHLAEARMDLTRRLSERGGEALEAEAADLDERMRAASEELPARRAAVACARQQLQEVIGRQSVALDAWSKTLDKQQACSACLRAASGRLADAAALLGEERARRGALRATLAALAGSVAALDAQLELLEIQECNAEVDPCFWSS